MKTLLSLSLLPVFVTLAEESVPKTAGDIDFPTIPAIMIPSVPSADKIQKTLEKDLDELLTPMGGIYVRPARCDQAGELIDEYSTTALGADGNFSRSSTAGIFDINQDGTGNAVTNDIVYTSEGDGIGSIVTQQERFMSEGDGEGSYSGKFGVIELDGDGGGRWSGGELGVIEINKDGSGTWTGGKQGVIEINADGSGTWVGGPLGVVENHGDGTGEIAGKAVKMSPIPPLQPVGKFPPIHALNPPKLTCGYVITLSNKILFDFDKSELRETLKPYLIILANAIKKAQVDKIEIRGHTDAKGSDSYNQALSEKRANTVMAALIKLDAPDKMTAIGFGETRPVAPNTLNGKDNPSGRQLNRRVEIFIKK